MNEFGMPAGQTHFSCGDARLSQILDLFVEDSWRRVYGGELEVRPPGAPTTEAG
jgi:hypothetical protein